GPITGYQCPVKDIAGGCVGPTECHYSNPRSCESYIQCTAGGVAYEMPCPVGLHWNNRAKLCDYPEVADCSAEFVCPVEDIVRTRCLGETDCVYPKAGNCRQFIACEVNPDGRTGRPTVKDCVPGHGVE
ncbi:unnamed protein product, partial [Medioppia subpectinata]